MPGTRPGMRVRGCLNATTMPVTASPARRSTIRSNTKVYGPRPAIIAKHNGRVLARAAAATRSWRGRRSFIASSSSNFRLSSRRRRGFNSPEYEEAAGFRRGGAGEVENVIVEGGDVTV